jgi:hypothetical protein
MKSRVLGVVMVMTLLLTINSACTGPEKAGDFPEFAPVQGCELVKQEKVLILKGAVSDQARLWTKTEHAPPFALRVKAKTDARNLRLYYSKGVVIFNWEGNENELRLHDAEMGGGLGIGIPGQGKIEPDKYHDIAWEVYPDGMRVLVNGKERGRLVGNYEKLKAPAGIGPAFGSVITIESFKVETLKGKLPEQK